VLVCPQGQGHGFEAPRHFTAELRSHK